MLQLSQSALDSGAGQAQLSGHGGHSGPAVALLIGPLTKVHIDRYRPVRQIGGVDGVKIPHSHTSLAGLLDLSRHHRFASSCEGASALLAGGSFSASGCVLLCIAFSNSLRLA